MEYALYLLITGVVIIVIGLLAVSLKKTSEDGVVSKEEFLKVLEDEVKKAPKELKSRLEHYIDVAKFKCKK